MANSKYTYVRNFEQYPTLLPDTWIVVRLDGRSFSRLSAHYHFSKPNDIRSLQLLNVAATSVLRQFPDIVLAYGQSDEYSFVLRPATPLYGRREAKIVTAVASAFTAAVVFHWPRFFASPAQELASGSPAAQDPATSTGAELDDSCLPSFDGRAVCYPTLSSLRDYLAWRQVDCHINNLYNTTFWALVLRGGLSNVAAERRLEGTFSPDKHELLFSQFGINYNNEPEMYRKGSVLYRDADVDERRATDDGKLGGEMKQDVADGKREEELSKTQLEKDRKRRLKAKITVEHVDIIKDEFWDRRPWILEGKPPPKYRISDEESKSI